MVICPRLLEGKQQASNPEMPRKTRVLAGPGQECAVRLSQR